MIPEVQRWREALAQEHQSASDLLSLVDSLQALVIARRFEGLADNMETQQLRVAELFQAERVRVATQQDAARALGVPLPGRRTEIYRHLPEDVAREIEGLVVRLQIAMEANQRRFQQNLLLLSRSIELAQQVLQRSGVTNTGRTYGAKGRAGAFSLPKDALSRWVSVV